MSQHIIDDLTQANTIVRHTALELKGKFTALVDTLEAQAHTDVAAVKDLIDTIVQAAHATASGPVLPEPEHQPVSILNPPVDTPPEVTAANPDASDTVPAAPVPEPVVTDDASKVRTRR